MFCPKCGGELPDRSKFCSYCGASINVSTPPQTPKVPKTPKAPKPKKQRSTKLLKPIIALLLCVLVLLGSVAYFLLPSILADDSNTPTAADPSGSDKPAISLRYDLKTIEKEAPDIKSLSKLEGGDEEARLYYSEVQEVEAFTEEFEQAAESEFGEISSSNLGNYLSETEHLFAELRDAGVISDYEQCDTGYMLTLSSGAYYYYAPEISDLDGGEGDSPELYVSTYQPCLDGYKGSSSWQYMDLVDEGAQAIDDAFDAYFFEDKDNFDNEEASLENIASMGKYHVVLWHGHGGYSEKLGPTLVTGIEVNFENCKKYAGAIANGSLVMGSTFLITPAFIENYVETGSLVRTIVYLGSCSSARDNRLVNAFLAKGAAAVYGNSDVISTHYNLEMINAVSEGLCTRNDDGSLRTVVEALNYAKSKVASSDPYGGYNASVRLFTDDESFALDWFEHFVSSDRSVVLALDSSSSMDGTPIIETKEAARLFVSSVLDENAVASVVSYSDYAGVNCSFTASREMLGSAIDKIGAGGRTNIYEALAASERMLDNLDSESKIIVLMSDGMPNSGLTGDDLIAYADTIKAKGISIYTLGFFQSLGSQEKYTAQQLLEAIAGEGCHYEVSTLSDLDYIFGDIAAQVNGQRYIYVKVEAPAEVSVSYEDETLTSEEDDLCTRSSFGTLGFENSEDGEEDYVKILRLKEGPKYNVKIEGTESGKLDYTVRIMDENGDYSDTRTFKNIKIGRKTVVDTVASNSEKTYLSVDKDGDGRYDSEYVAGENEKAELVDKTLDYIVMGIGSAAILGIAVCTLIIVIRVKRRKAQKAAVGF